MYQYQDSLSSFENEAVAGGIATCETYNEFLQYYRMLAYHGRPGELIGASPSPEGRVDPRRFAPMDSRLEQASPSRRGETYRQSQKRAAALWAHVRTFRAEFTPPSTPVADEVEEGGEPAENICPICCEAKPAADEDGHCSYECASGGGKVTAKVTAKVEAEEPEETLKEDLSTIGVTLALFTALGYWLMMVWFGATQWSR
jgi:hypothetical protein